MYKNKLWWLHTAFFHIPALPSPGTASILLSQPAAGDGMDNANSTVETYYFAHMTECSDCESLHFLEYQVGEQTI